MTKIYIREEANIDTCPVPLKITRLQVTEICIGDLHGNALKFMYFLIRQGIVDISTTDYSHLVSIYKTPLNRLTSSLLAEFKCLIQRIKIIDKAVLIRLIGDEMGDRGANDYFMLEILYKLTQENAKIEILLSNHGMEFIEAYEQFSNRNQQFQSTRLGGNFTTSLYALNEIIQRGLIKSGLILTMIDDSYKSHLKLIHYSRDKKNNGMTIFSHAGIGLQTLYLMARQFEVDYNDDSPLNLATTIDAINEAFRIFVNNNQVHTIYTEVEFALWNRSYTHLYRPNIHNGYLLYFVHGHDSGEETEGNIYNLDNLLGKAPHLHREIYTALVSDEVSMT